MDGQSLEGVGVRRVVDQENPLPAGDDFPEEPQSHAIAASTTPPPSAFLIPAAVYVMARLQLGRTLADREVADIVAFLESLTGRLPDNVATTPRLAAASARS